MRPSHFVRKSLSYHARSHTPAVLGAALAGAVLLASLYVGDSVRGGLERLAEVRQAGIGVRVVAETGPMGEHLAKGLSSDLGRAALPVWHLQGTLSSRDGAVEVPEVHLYGVNEAFWPAWDEPQPPEGVHRVNEALAKRLSAGGANLQDLVFRGRPLSALAADAPLAATNDELTPLPIWASPYAGMPSRVGPPQRSREPLNLFVPLPWIQERLRLGSTINEVWVPGTEDTEKVAHRAELSLVKHAEPSDLGLTLTERREGVAVGSPRLLLPSAVAKRALELPHARAHLTWFIDTVSSDHGSVPFTFASAVHAPDDRMMRNLKPGEALVNEWLAQDLQLSKGDTITLDYHRVEDASRDKPTGRATLTVARVLPMAGLGADRSLTPPFPGLKSAKRCRDWDPGVAMDRARIRERDEKYWQLHGASPKIIVSLDTGQELWASRFGDLNEVVMEEHDALAVAGTILATTPPKALGVHVRDVSHAARAAASPATDFGTLFLGFTSVLLIAALVLTGLLFGLSLDRRMPEIETMRRLGVPERRVRSLVQREALSLAVAGLLVACLVAPLLADWTLYGLQSVWPETVGQVDLPVTWSWLSVVLGSMANLVLIYLAQSIALRQSLKRQHGRAPASTRRALGPSAVAAAGGVVGALCALMVDANAVAPDAAFFVLGSGALFSSLVGVRAALSTLPATTPWTGLLPLAVRGAQREPGRSLAMIVSLALAAFLVVGVGAHAPPPPEAGDTLGPTGGFSLVAESTTGLGADVRSEHGRARLGLLEEDLAGARLWPVRERSGDDASCLSPGQAANPTILGLDAAALATRGAFTPLGSLSSQELWSLLLSRTASGAVPVIGDEATLRWGLGLGVGDQHVSTTESGEPVTFEVVGMVARSLLQGALWTSDTHLAELYPHSSETRMLLIEAPRGSRDDIRAALQGALGDLGAYVQPAEDRLAEYTRVETSYVRIFLAFGLLGLLFGSGAVCVLLVRNALARERELAVLRAIGQSKIRVWLYLTAEHVVLVFIGLGLGSFAALVGLWPTLSERGVQAPTMAMVSLGVIITLTLLITSSVAWRCVNDEPAEVLASSA